MLFNCYLWLLESSYLDFQITPSLYGKLCLLCVSMATSCRSFNWELWKGRRHDSLLKHPTKQLVYCNTFQKCDIDGEKGKRRTETDRERDVKRDAGEGEKKEK